MRHRQVVLSRPVLSPSLFFPLPPPYPAPVPPQPFQSGRAVREWGVRSGRNLVTRGDNPATSGLNKATRTPFTCSQLERSCGHSPRSPRHTARPAGRKQTEGRWGFPSRCRSPDMTIIMIHGLPKSLSHATNTVQYADDIHGNLGECLTERKNLTSFCELCNTIISKWDW